MSHNAITAFVALLVLTVTMAIGYFKLFDTAEELEADQQSSICKLAEKQGKYLTCSAD